tara:strand:- start:47 stop:340 length:294 start_codon:yes stop_codon:yes gene_type:complete
MTKLNKTDAKKLKKILKNHYDFQREIKKNKLDLEEIKSKRLLSELIKDFTQTKETAFINSFDATYFLPYKLSQKSIKSGGSARTKSRKKDRLTLRKR